MNPRTERIAYQIRNLIHRTGGDCTLHDMAEETGESWQVCKGVCEAKGFTDYRRTTGYDAYRTKPHLHFEGADTDLRDFVRGRS